MAQVSVTVNGRSYDVTCDDGQEAHLRKLAQHLDQRVQGLADTIGQVGEQRLLVMAGLLVADELFEAFTRIHALTPNANGNERKAQAGDDAAARALDACARRVEAIVARLVDA